MNLKTDYQEAGKIARAIVAKRVAIVAAVPTALTMATALGFHVPGTGQVQGVVVTVLDGLSLVVGVLWAQSGTTPADPNLNPTDIHGQSLVPLVGQLVPYPKPAPVGPDLASINEASLPAVVTDAPDDEYPAVET